jgi:hypothetical protein
MARNPRSAKSKQSVILMALAAIEGRLNPLDDVDMGKVNPCPVSLDLPEEEYEELFFTHCCTSQALTPASYVGSPREGTSLACPE